MKSENIVIWDRLYSNLNKAFHSVKRYFGYVHEGQMSNFRAYNACAKATKCIILLFCAPLMFPYNLVMKRRHFTLPLAYLEITTNVGCPVICKFCPQKMFIGTYLKSSTIVNMRMDDFRRSVDKLPDNSIVSFAGFSEPFKNKQCTNMVLYAMNKHFVILNTTLIGLSVDDYKRFCTSKRFLMLRLHIPDCEGNSTMNINDEYLKTLDFVVTNKPKHATWSISMHGEKESPLISHIIKHNTIQQLNDRAGNLSDDKGLVAMRHSKGKIGCGHMSLNATKGGGALILPDGTALLCCNDWSMEYVIGNGFEQSLEEMKKSKSFRKCISSCNNPDEFSICRACVYAIKA